MDFIVKYKGNKIGEVNNGKYIPDINQPEGIFNFLKKSIEDINSVNFFTYRIKNCERFPDLSITYSTDEYEFVKK